MLRLYDARARTAVDVTPARAGVLAVRSSASGPRDALVVDVLRRLLGLGHVRLVVDEPARGHDAVLAPAGSVTGPGEGADVEPVVTRLALLAVPYRDPATLDDVALARAAEQLAGWRASVAAWAERPSARMPPDYVDAVVGALEDDLGTPGALGVLQRLAADQAVSDGARFETFAWADRVLGLELVRDVGR